MDVFELIDFSSGNLVGSYDSREDALAAIRRAYEDHGWTAIQGLGLMRVEESGHQELLAADAELGQLALGPIREVVEARRADR